jgi:hypothetical protein
VDPEGGTVFASGGWDEAHNELMVILGNGSSVAPPPLALCCLCRHCVAIEMIASRGR